MAVKKLGMEETSDYSVDSNYTLSGDNSVLNRALNHILYLSFVYSIIVYCGESFHLHCIS